MRGFCRAKIEKGFTLIEIIASLAIVGLGLVGIMSLFPVGIDATRRARDLTNASVLARGVVDQIRTAASKGELSLNDAERLFETSRPEPFDEDAFNNIVPFVDNEMYEFEVHFGEPRGGEATFDDLKEAKFDDLRRGVGLEEVTVRVSWPSNEPEVELRNRVTLVTFIRFSRLR
jgi:prepilin-type N-terminal cleavage/methylation domain-containing protein